MRLLITGCGIVSAIGVGCDETLEALLASRSGIGQIHHLVTTHSEFPVGEVHLSNDEMKSLLGIAAEAPCTRTALLGIMAMREALCSAHLSTDDLAEVAFINGTTVGGMDKTEQHYLDFTTTHLYDDYIRTHDCGACSEAIADHFGRFSLVTTTSTACSSAANAIILGAELIQSGRADIVIAGGAECLTRFHLNGFNSLCILDTAPCRPFDASRAGLNLGEGAAYLVIESERHAHRRGAKPLAFFDGYGNACDAFHQTASSPDGEGAYRAMRAALRMANLNPSDVSYINAHGTSTPNNDSSESAAMRRIFGDHIPPVSSTKSFTGHTTSASGSIEAVICLLALRHHFIPANLNFKHSADDCVKPVDTLLTDVSLSHVLCNSFGFGGNDSSLLFSSTTTSPLPSSIATPAAKTVYIYSAQQISVQEPFSLQWIGNPQPCAETYNTPVDPDFKAFVTPNEARRMGKLLKRAIAVSKQAIAQASNTPIDAIFTGTGHGCMANTLAFLDAMCHDGEQMLKPTHFMQSTHNTIGSLLAKELQCHGYNITYSHRFISFSSALLDAFIQLQSGVIGSALVGGHDELPLPYLDLLHHVALLEPQAGECATAFVIGTDPDKSQPLCKLDDIAILYRPTDVQLANAVDAMLRRHNRELDDISALFSDLEPSEAQVLFPNLRLLRYKRLFGDNYTAPSLALYAAACCLSEGCLPATLCDDASPTDEYPKPTAFLTCCKGLDKTYTIALVSAL